MMKQRHDRTPTHRHGPGAAVAGLVLTILCLGAAGASEVYTWTDENGVVHFSDSPRAGGEMATLEVQEIYRPGSTDEYAAPAAPADDVSAAPDGTPEEPPKSPAQLRREEIADAKRDRREKQAEMDRLCAQHRQRLERMEPARRVFYTNDQGESVRMDDDQRIAMVDESKAFLAENCGR